MRIDWWSRSDTELLAQCRIDHYRARGPGGQHRNKTDSAVRLVHQPTGIVVTATERRSQHENRAHALRRLRAALAFQNRQPVDKPLPDWLRELCCHGRLVLGERDPRFLHASAVVLDLLVEHNGQVATVAAVLGVSTASVVKFLRTNPAGWQAAQHIRHAAGQPLLR